MKFRSIKLSRRGKIFAIVSTSILVWGGQTFVWNPFWLDYRAYFWYALFWGFTITWIIPKRERKKQASNLLDDPLPPPSLESLQEPENV